MLALGYPRRSKSQMKNGSNKLERVWETCRTNNGETSKIESEMNVAKSQADEQTGKGTGGRGNLLTIREMGTTGGTRQMDPGICFHPAYVNSHTQNSCAINMVNSIMKNTTTPGSKGLLAHRKTGV